MALWLCVLSYERGFQEREGGQRYRAWRVLRAGSGVTHLETSGGRNAALRPWGTGQSPGYPPSPRSNLPSRGTRPGGAGHIHFINVHPDFL